MSCCLGLFIDFLFFIRYGIFRLVNKRAYIISLGLILGYNYIFFRSLKISFEFVFLEIVFLVFREEVGFVEGIGIRRVRS